ncbi:hypothetical protein ACR77J_07785 [Tissierella praeacuta]|uniref:hypothetical protein n=1 Tax=Tissierella praeacuta TaxID=43131 RepID=UPI003DA408ED
MEDKDFKDSYYAIELAKEINSNCNDRIYRKGEMLIVWLDDKCYRVVNNNMDFIPFDKVNRILYKIKFEEYKYNFGGVGVSY